MSSQLADSLPPDHTLCLPSEAEWEAAAAYAGPGARRAYPWGDEAPTLEYAVYDAWQLGAPAPVGLCPAGMAACGALDLAGNVWEWASSSSKAYPEGAAALVKDFTDDDYAVPYRGGAYYGNSTIVRCGARSWVPPSYGYDNPGFRVVVVPRARTNVLFSAS
ncbi:MAG: hypothetical protein EI684_05820 [Candidatus Viridilinea halotolerans]|uniref:Sulfatase-modifying factor enzyme-like domain-containing protein n=1 Tax=Candidatus Viridilinea halotolerans TaxID=2491704 RepID=A0A426U4X9_9CHLR|nr:MAG: hypothetical protein EI684_05820 [Candidatus Viridilinea halotolerans]